MKTLYLKVLYAELAFSGGEEMKGNNAKDFAATCIR